MRDFASTWGNLLEYCIPVKCLLIEGEVQGGLAEELSIAPFVESINTPTLGKVLIIDFASTWSCLLKNNISAKVLLIEG